MSINASSIKNNINLNSAKKVFKSLTTSKYKKYKSSVLKSLAEDKIIKTENERIINKINPINNRNIASIKRKIIELLKDEKKSEIIEKIKKTETPDELYKIIREDVFSLFSKGPLIAIKSNMSKITEKYLKLGALIEILTPNSNCNKVKELEAKIKKLGIQTVNLSDDYNYGQAILEALTKALKKFPNLELPNALTITPAMPTGQKGLTFRTNKHLDVFLAPLSNVALYRKNRLSALALLEKNQEFIKGKPKHQEKLKRELQVPVTSTNSTAHIFLHELGHQYGRFSLLSRKENKTARNLSGVSGQKLLKLPLGSEAGPELFAKITDGAQLTKEEQILEKKLRIIKELESENNP